MKLEKRSPSGREKDEASVELLAKLREQLYNSNVSTVRQSAFNLSWMQEDGLEILKEALFGKSSRRTKSAAAYGLRKMRGRMRQRAEEALVEGLKHADSKTAEICGNALLVLKRGKRTNKTGKRQGAKRAKFDIREIPGKGLSGRRARRGNRPDNHVGGRRRL
jgi:hypothetical protein